MVLVRQSEATNVKPRKITCPSMTDLEKLSAPFQPPAHSDSGEDVILHSLPPLDVFGLKITLLYPAPIMVSLFASSLD